MAFCTYCGKDVSDAAAACPNCGHPRGVSAFRTGGTIAGADKKIHAALTAILLPGLGIHKFILGYQSAGFVMLLVSVLTLGIGLLVMAPISFIEGIIYLSKSDQDFVTTYVVGDKQWF